MVSTYDFLPETKDLSSVFNACVSPCNTNNSPPPLDLTSATHSSAPTTTETIASTQVNTHLLTINKTNRADVAEYLSGGIHDDKYRFLLEVLPSQIDYFSFDCKTGEFEIRLSENKQVSLSNQTFAKVIHTYNTSFTCPSVIKGWVRINDDMSVIFDPNCSITGSLSVSIGLTYLLSKCVGKVSMSLVKIKQMEQGKLELTTQSNHEESLISALRPHLSNGSIPETFTKSFRELKDLLKLPFKW